MEDALLNRVLAIMSNVAGPGRTPPDPGSDTRLWDGGFWLDSIELFTVLLACDDAFGPVPEGQPDLRPATLATVGSLVTALRERVRA